jgi:hypothetical protein
MALARLRRGTFAVYTEYAACEAPILDVAADGS